MQRSQEKMGIEVTKGCSYINFSKLKKDINTSGLTYIVAVSGGVDSMFLLDFFRRSSAKFVVAHFNHMIHKHDWVEQHHVTEFCIEHDIDFFVGQGQNIQSEADAREQRYAFFRSIATRLDIENSYRVVTGHHWDDQIETILLRLIRGLPHDSLTMVEDNGFVFRPFLELDKDYIIRYCTRNNISWVEDPTNNELKYDRNKIRNTVIPELLKIKNIRSSMRKGMKKKE